LEKGVVGVYGRSLTINALRHTIETHRTIILSGQYADPISDAQLLNSAKSRLAALLVPTLKPVINGTGVIVHTNLGRAPLSVAALNAIQDVGMGYATLEYDLQSGARGSRTVHAENLLTRITQSEAALVVNNNASSVILMLTALCQGKEVIISRGQLVEIGGGFRIPDVMAQSGAHLVEVGTTNRTHIHDYVNAINENTGAILVAHHSNYKIIGFTSEPSLNELAEVAHAHNIPLLYDQGSGALLDTGQFGLEPEPTVQEALEAGCDVVAFSGDKLLGGPQAGILCGQADYVAAMKQHPLARAVRADKLCLAALSATLTSYLSNQALSDIPVWQMIAKSVTDIAAVAQKWAQHLKLQGVEVEVVNGRSTVGGGSLPGTSLPTLLIAITIDDCDAYAHRLRDGETAVIGRIQDNQYLIDPRTILPRQVDILLQSLVNCFRHR
ncbi:MAG: L-seryl-tRNA(Sec) selenium transferase, partial [Chloroflexi bacterium]|nr:L-seryl-tRNA(Sec) selenium transferase [Chloroflexota bacterium]